MICLMKLEIGIFHHKYVTQHRVLDVCHHASILQFFMNDVSKFRKIIF